MQAPAAASSTRARVRLTSPGSPVCSAAASRDFHASAIRAEASEESPAEIRISSAAPASAAARSPRDSKQSFANAAHTASFPAKSNSQRLVSSGTSWQRDRVVGSSAEGFPVVRMSSVCGGGSSSVLSRAFWDSSFMRSASQMIPTLQLPPPVLVR